MANLDLAELNHVRSFKNEIEITDKTRVAKLNNLNVK